MPKYTVKKQSSGRTLSESWDVYYRGQRVTYIRYPYREDAERHAAQLTQSQIGAVSTGVTARRHR
jgi:hypothetical protein